MPHKYTNVEVFESQEQRGMWKEHPLKRDNQFIALTDIIDAIPSNMNMDDCVIRYDDEGLSLYSPINPELWKEELNVQPPKRPTRLTN